MRGLPSKLARFLTPTVDLESQMVRGFALESSHSIADHDMVDFGLSASAWLPLESSPSISDSDMVDMDYQNLPLESNHSTADSHIVDLDSENACCFLSNLTV